jgi:hypothetical protein
MEPICKLRISTTVQRPESTARSPPSVHFTTAQHCIKANIGTTNPHKFNQQKKLQQNHNNQDNNQDNN